MAPETKPATKPATRQRAGLGRGSLTPARLGARLSLVTAVVAMAVMFGAGLLLGRVVVVLGGWGGGSAGAWVPLVAGAAGAVFSAQGSARRMLRARRRRLSAA